MRCLISFIPCKAKSRSLEGDASRAILSYFKPAAPGYFPVTTDEPALREYLFKRSAENIRNESTQQKKLMEFKFPFVLA
jgi:hypothetical protein